MIRLGLRLSLEVGVRPRYAFSSLRQPSPSASACCWPAWPESTGYTPRPTVVRGSTPRRRRHHRPRHRTGCGGCRAPTSSATRRSTAIDVAAAGPNAPIPPGLPHLPGPGEYYASPALTTLLRSEPANELRDRYPGRPDRDHRCSGAAVPELADHRHRPHRAPALAGTWCGRGRSHPTHAGQLLRLPEHRRERIRSAVHSGRRSRRALAASADLDRDRQPTVGRAARGALRRYAPRRRHATSDFGVSPRWRQWSRLSRASQSASHSSSSSDRCSTTCRSPERPSPKATSRCTGSTSCSP
jgi:hypothetical protein